jgi:hypothetical protein
MQSNDIIAQFKEVTQLKPDWEKGVVVCLRECVDSPRSAFIS